MTDATVVEETIEAIERIPTAHLNGTTKKQQVIILSVTVVAGLLVGGGVSHILTKKSLTTKFEAKLEEEMEGMRVFYARSNKADVETGRPLTPKDVFEGGLQVDKETKRVLTDYQGKGNAHRIMETPKIVAEPPVATEAELMEGTWVQSADGTEMTQENIFAGREPVEDENWDLVSEIVNRTPEKPFILSHDEYYEGEQEYEQDELTFYAGDGILADTQDVEVDDVEGTVGIAHLAMFGHGSRDANIVYIRNDRLRCDFEVTKSPGTYAHEVMQFEADDNSETELRHSDSRPRKMRYSDE